MELPENEKLTPEEKAYLLKHIKNNERNYRSWTRNRWINLFFACLLLCAGMFCFYVYYDVRSKEYVWEQFVKVYPNAPISVDTLNQQSRNILYCMTQIRAPIMVFINAFIILTTGMMLFVRTLVEWNRHHRERVMNKIFRRFLRENSSADQM